MFFQEVKIEHEQKTMKLAEVKKVSLGPLLLLLKMMTLVENNDPGPFKAFEMPGQPKLCGSIMAAFSTWELLPGQAKWVSDSLEYVHFSQQRLLNAGLIFCFVFLKRGEEWRLFMKRLVLWRKEKNTCWQTWKHTSSQTFNHSSTTCTSWATFPFLISRYTWLSPYFFSMLVTSLTSAVQKHKYRAWCTCSIARQYSYLPLCYWA